MHDLLMYFILTDKCMFHNEELCGGSSNKFFELSLAETHLAVTDSIGGQRRQVRKIMVFNSRWIIENWADPMKVCVHSCFDLQNVWRCSKTTFVFQLLKLHSWYLCF